MALALIPERCAGLPIINNEADMKVGFDIPYEPRMTEQFPSWLASAMIAHDALTWQYRDSGLRFSVAADNANLQLVQAPFDGRRSLLTRGVTRGSADLFKLPVYHFYELLRLLGDRRGVVTAGGEHCYPATDLFHLLTIADEQIGALFSAYPADGTRRATPVGGLHDHGHSLANGQYRPLPDRCDARECLHGGGWAALPAHPRRGHRRTYPAGAGTGPLCAYPAGRHARSTAHSATASRLRPSRRCSPGSRHIPPQSRPRQAG